LIHEAGVEAIREKSLRLTGYLRRLIETRLSDRGFQCVSPAEDEHRGGHVAVQHAQAFAVSQRLRERGVIPDFRQPNILRLAPAPLYTSFQDAFRAVETIEQILRDGDLEAGGSDAGTWVT
jgi:kynureninase